MKHGFLKHISHNIFTAILFSAMLLFAGGICSAQNNGKTEQVEKKEPMSKEVFFNTLGVKFASLDPKAQEMIDKLWANKDFSERHQEFILNFLEKDLEDVEPSEKNRYLTAMLCDIFYGYTKQTPLAENGMQLTRVAEAELSEETYKRQQESFKDFAAGLIEHQKAYVLQTKGEISQTKGEISQTKGEISQTKGEISQIKGETSQIKGETSQIEQRILEKGKKIEESYIELYNLQRSKTLTAREKEDLASIYRGLLELEKTGYVWQNQQEMAKVKDWMKSVIK